MTMTISEALCRIEKLVQAKGESFEDAKAWDVIRSRLEEGDADLAAVYALGKYDGKRLKVSDEMVVRANDAYQEHALEHPLSEFICSGEATEEYMKAALVAALGE